MAEIPVSERDARSLAEKLAAFSQTLTPGELAAFQLIERELGHLAAEEGVDVEGYLMPHPVISEMVAKTRRDDMLAEAERERQAREATSVPTPGAITRSGFWYTILSVLTLGQR